MASGPRNPNNILNEALRLLESLPPAYRPIAAIVGVVILLVVLVAFIFWSKSHEPAGSPKPTTTAPSNPTEPDVDPTPVPTLDAPGDYLFCFWNVENLFDDRDDGRTNADERYDKDFAHNPAKLARKLDHLSDTLLRLNDGRGPDILALAEVETVRAAELLRRRLNAKLGDKAVPYSQPVMRPITSGRHIAPAILTRLPVVRDRTRLFPPQRILQAHLRVNGKELIVIASHWTSRISDKSGTDANRGRPKYADMIHGIFRGMYISSPEVALIVCGDFNDTPNDVSVRDHLKATGERPSGQPGDFRLFNLMANRNPSLFGTHYYGSGRSGEWFIFDQIVVSPAMLRPKGWQCDPDSVRTIREKLTKPGDPVGRPWRFEDEPPGYSDHFPVTVKLTVD